MNNFKIITEIGIFFKKVINPKGGRNGGGKRRKYVSKKTQGLIFSDHDGVKGTGFTFFLKQLKIMDKLQKTMVFRHRTSGSKGHWPLRERKQTK